MPRVVRSAYIAPTSNRFGTRSTALEKVVEALASQSGNIVAPHGANAANALGLNQQFPICEVYLTSGRTRKFTLGCSKIMVKHAPRLTLALDMDQACVAVRALARLGPMHDSKTLAVLHRCLKPIEWKALESTHAVLPIMDGAPSARKLIVSGPSPYPDHTSMTCPSVVTTSQSWSQSLRARARRHDRPSLRSWHGPLMRILLRTCQMRSSSS
ncbi:DUF6088 family protein [Polaromonas sp. CG_23.6]|uniref:DUF6088 family protein n=1 Tax=Polaromonas sp. CG_23.6 TaxID=2760709 RepID=UPI002475A7E8|nr:DUF6088 family protein [Polaromonas sp. CG_23.6]MDH6185845.1 hypothetical protein [Polaromonas sp. CG_23.6]